VSEPVLRAPRPGDAAPIAALVNEHAVALGGPPDMTAALIEEWWAAPGTDPETDAVIVEREGEVVDDGAPEAVGLLDRHAVELGVAPAPERVGETRDVRRIQLLGAGGPCELTRYPLASLGSH